MVSLRAHCFAEAILWQGGEAKTAKEAFRMLPTADRENLIQFLEIL
ncbi:MAG: di-heme oxidoredictase family protein [Myxococcota bacterium]|nr:di-heme oxidoredictase family protein [Myxococcota bacterium]